MSDADTSGLPTIEVGAADGDLRYWRAKEAVRQGEARLAAQAAIRTALEARATALTGWASVSLLAATGASFSAGADAGFFGAIASGVLLFTAAAIGIHAARPRNWAVVGYDPSVITQDNLGTELEVLESIAAGLSPGIQANNIRLNGMGLMLRWAGWLLIAAPIVGALAYWQTPVLISAATGLRLLFQ